MLHSSNDQVYRTSTSWNRERAEIVNRRHLVFRAELITGPEKKNGSIRLCADHSTGLNDALEQNQHLLPIPEDTFTKLNGGRYFSQLDLAEAYLQLEVDDVSKQLFTINTHRGLYRFNRLPFGVKPAPGIFQQCMDTLIAGLDGTAAYLNDMFVTGRTIGEHNARLEAVFKRIQDYGFRVPLDKYAFLQTEITYLGLNRLYEVRKLAQSQPPFSSVGLRQPQKYHDDSQSTTQSPLKPNKDENARKKLCLLAHDGFRHRKTRQDLPKMCILGKG
ncbi:hypothetical protein RB195_022488 [Necator americanus]|uniref:Reverse transcriptase domain-containing protein n=1 Tax=Necator americanus TaxID=51031 RepID=A0ABR1EFH1_NECAM